MTFSRRAKGIDQRGIVTSRGVKSVSNERTFSKDLGKKSEVLSYITSLSERVSQRLQKKNLRGKTVQIKVRWSDFTTITRQTTLSQSINDFKIIQNQASDLLDQVWQEGRFIRLIGVGVHNLDSKAQQLGLWDTGVVKDIQLQDALKELKDKYGENVISRGIKK